MTLPFVSNLGHPLRLHMHNGFWCYFLFQLSEILRPSSFYFNSSMKFPPSVQDYNYMAIYSMTPFSRG
jgi:hypothetical protein